MSSLLPMKETSREVVVEVARTLQPWFPEITAAWRQQMFAEFNFDGRAMAALERLTIGTGFSIFSQTDFATFYSNLQHFGERLAKLEVSARAVARSLEIYQQLIDPYLEKIFPPNRLPEVHGAPWRPCRGQLRGGLGGALRRAEDRGRNPAVGAGRGALGRQSRCPAATACCKSRPTRSTRTLGVILLTRRRAAGVAGAGAGRVLGEDLDDWQRSADAGRGPCGKDCRHRRAGDPARSARFQHEALDPIAAATRRRRSGACRCKSNDAVIGVLLIGFSRPHDWLPTERHLLRAIADRSALAIDRAGMTDALREREMRIAELSGHLMHAQEEERKRISRELHDETGQALMVIRLYLGMLESSVSARWRTGEDSRDAGRGGPHHRRHPPHHRPAVAAGAAGAGLDCRRPQGSQRSGQERRREGAGDGCPPISAGCPPPLETAIYRVVQEALHNVAKHASATTVNIEMKREGDTVAPADRRRRRRHSVAETQSRHGRRSAWPACGSASETSEER